MIVLTITWAVLGSTWSWLQNEEKYTSLIKVLVSSMRHHRRREYAGRHAINAREKRTYTHQSDRHESVISMMPKCSKYCHKDE